jgi:hypothetical protein
MAMRQNMSARARAMRNPRTPRVNPAMRTRAMGARGRAMNARPRRPMGNRARMMRSQRGMM